MDHDDLIRNLIANSDPDDPLSAALIDNIRERKRIFRDMLGNSRFLKNNRLSSNDESGSGALQ